MKRSLVLVMAMFTLSSFAIADAQKINPRDPSVWQDKKTVEDDKSNPCEVFTESVCPGHQDSKTDIEREKDRRETQRLKNERETGK